jgi:hypothetical protein
LIGGGSSNALVCLHPATPNQGGAAYLAILRRRSARFIDFIYYAEHIGTFSEPILRMAR